MKRLFVSMTATLIMLHNSLLFSANPNPYPATSLLNSAIIDHSDATHLIIREGAQRVLGFNLNTIYSKRVKKELEKTSQQESKNSSGTRQLEKRLQLRRKLEQNRLNKQN